MKLDNILHLFTSVLQFLTDFSLGFAGIIIVIALIATLICLFLAEHQNSFFIDIIIFGVFLLALFFIYFSLILLLLSYLFASFKLKILFTIMASLILVGFTYAKIITLYENIRNRFKD